MSEDKNQELYDTLKTEIDAGMITPQDRYSHFDRMSSKGDEYSGVNYTGVTISKEDK
jgi:hypothetical protein